MNIVILHSEVPPHASQDEQDVLAQVHVVSQALCALGYSPVAVPLSLDLPAVVHTVQRLHPVCVFNLVETVTGQGYGIHLGPLVLEMLHLPYTGVDMTAMFATSNKLIAKQCLVAAGLPTPPWCSVAEIQRGSVPFTGPYIVKSVWEHGSIGLDDDAVVVTPAQIRPVLAQRCQTYGGLWFVERYIAGREFNLSLLAGDAGPELLPPAEMEFMAYPPEKVKIVGYAAKWHTTSFEYQHTCRHFAFPLEDAALLARLEELVHRCWQHFALRGYARIDFRVDEAGVPWVLEVNANPCLAPDSGFIAAAQQAGYTTVQVVQRILADVADTPLRAVPWDGTVGAARTSGG